MPAPASGCTAPGAARARRAHRVRAHRADVAKAWSLVLGRRMDRGVRHAVVVLIAGIHTVERSSEILAQDRTHAVDTDRDRDRAGGGRRHVRLTTAIRAEHHEKTARPPRGGMAVFFLLIALIDRILLDRRALPVPRFPLMLGLDAEQLLGSLQRAP